MHSEIEGWPAGETRGIDVSGVPVILHGNSRTYSAVTDSDGKFYFSVPPGKYRVEFISGEYYVNSGDDFWYNPRGFLLHSGECATLQLVSSRHKTVPKT